MQEKHPRVLEKFVFANERLRVFFVGIYGAVTSTALLIANQVFHAGPSAKVVLQLSEGIGYLTIPFFVFWAKHQNFKAARIASIIWTVAALCILVASYWDNVYAFVSLVFLAKCALFMAVPFMVQIYQKAFPESRRGKRMSVLRFIQVLTISLGGIIIGKILDNNLEDYHKLYFGAGVLVSIIAYMINRNPSNRVPREKDFKLFSYLTHFKEDKLFRCLVISWMLHAFAYHTMIGLFVDYLANPRFGLNASPLIINVLTVTVPFAVVFCSTFLMGRLFDKLKYQTLQVMLNSFLILSFVFYFNIKQGWALPVGAAFLGLEWAIGNIAFQMWITKVAPKGKTIEYSSAHHFLCAFPIMLGPVFGFFLSDYLGSVEIMTWCVIPLILTSLILLYTIKDEERLK
jgi:predicted MFS family arabinose efflux permease